MHSAQARRTTTPTPVRVPRLQPNKVHSAKLRIRWSRTGIGVTVHRTSLLCKWYGQYPNGIMLKPPFSCTYYAATQNHMKFSEKRNNNNDNTKADRNDKKRRTVHERPPSTHRSSAHISRVANFRRSTGIQTLCGNTISDWHRAGIRASTQLDQI